MKNISYRTLSKESGVSRGSLQNIFNIKDVSKVSVGTVIRLSEYFKVSLDDLLFKDLGK
ncbi:helix-turn-helix domain-containing protein [Sharpea azabuensis]|uniref:helix-turn-helix domain-containing protein n=1 Tax=Sharpea azabuensis TaxID=322505 RepID=UPI003B75CBB0